ncbi:MAG: hypothetical protein HZB29_09955 [Nitrospinae bacterium]|nr:hypothetical protein [Nitrospinota bacterium]
MNSLIDRREDAEKLIAFMLDHGWLRDFADHDYRDLPCNPISIGDTGVIARTVKAAVLGHARWLERDMYGFYGDEDDL